MQRVGDMVNWRWPIHLISALDAVAWRLGCDVEAVIGSACQIQRLSTRPTTAPDVQEQNCETWWRISTEAAEQAAAEHEDLAGDISETAANRLL